MSAKEVCEHPGHLVLCAATAVANQTIKRALALPDSIQATADYLSMRFCAVHPEALGAVMEAANATFQVIHQGVVPVVREICYA